MQDCVYVHMNMYNAALCIFVCILHTVYACTRIATYELMSYAYMYMLQAMCGTRHSIECLGNL